MAEISDHELQKLRNNNIRLMTFRQKVGKAYLSCIAGEITVNTLVARLQEYINEESLGR